MIWRLDWDSGNELDDGISLCFIYLDSWMKKNYWEFFFCVLSTASELTFDFFSLHCLGILKVHSKFILIIPLFIISMKCSELYFEHSAHQFLACLRQTLNGIMHESSCDFLNSLLFVLFATLHFME